MAGLPAPPTNALLGAWRTRIVDALAAADVVADVGVKRPADVTNLDSSFVRIVLLGGPWQSLALWHPRLVLESWAETFTDANQLDSIAAVATLNLEGTQGDGWYVTYCRLANQGASRTYEGHPFTMTTTEPLCVSVDLPT